MNEIINFTAADMPDNTVIFSEDIQPGESITKSARLFYIGKHKGRDYGKGDLARIVQNFSPDEGIPLQLDHSKSARDTIGFPKKLWLSSDGTEIHGDLEFRGRDNVEKVRLGLWKKLSIALGIKHPDMKMDHVAVTPFPALEGAAMFDNSKDKKGSDTMDEKVEFTKLQEEFAKLKEDADKRQAEFTKAQELLATYEKEKAELAEKVRFADDEKTIETFSQPDAEGNVKTTPGMKAEELALYHSLSDGQRELFAKYKEKMPAFLNTKILNTQSATKPGEKEMDEERVKRLCAKE